MSDIKVTVVCITYKHEDFIRDALDSFISQKTNFRYQILVGEDCGSDKTADIVKEYAEKYPDLVIPFIREKNMGAQRNLIDLCQRASSPYIALCEGDDYWIDEYKLQKQYDYMENHKDLKACFAQARIDAPEDWFLRSYFKVNKDNELIYPECEPDFKFKGEFLTKENMITSFPAHTSTIFYRWDSSVIIPEWYYEGIVGDWPLFLLQMGNAKVGYIREVVSVYRRSDVGIYMSQSMDEHFMKSRIDLVRIFSGMLEYYEENFPVDYPKIAIENKIKLEMSNFIRTALKLQDKEAIMGLFGKYPNAMIIGLQAYVNFYFDSRKMTAMYTWEGNKAVARDLNCMRIIRPIIKFYLLAKKFKDKMKGIFYKIKKRLSHFLRIVGYWGYSLIPKDKTLWVFSGFNKKNYFDNTMYLYEYLIKNHPEIKPVWITADDKVYNKLQSENKPVYNMRSLRGCLITARASIAVVDHFVMSDFSPIYGYNYKSKVVQLWHGVGFKAMGNKDKVLNTTVEGVVYSDDILIKKDDNIFRKLKKRISYFLKAPMRELFEQYFMFVCPGQERIDMIGEVWGVNSNSYFMVGHPRNLPLYESATYQSSKRKIIYAPTYRFNYKKEKEMIELCIDFLDKIEDLMNKWNCEFVIRLHPHTWRNYKEKLDSIIKGYNCIELDNEKDVYKMLGNYDILLTDYSSISLDLAMINKPVIYVCPDYEWFCENEAGFNLNFKESIPGPMVSTWEQALLEVEEYLKDPRKDSNLRKEKCKYFFDPEVNSIDNSEKICQEIKRRLAND